MKKTTFHVYEKGIFGIKNPTFWVVLDSSQIKGTFRVLIDNIDTNFDISENRLENKITIQASVGNGKKAKLINISNDESYVICKARNILFIRIINRIKYCFYNSFLSLFHILKLFARGVYVLWSDYRFLVPPNKWKYYINKLKKRLSEGPATYFYDPFKQNEYLKWLKNNEIFEKKEFSYNPLISILIPTYNINKKYLSECLDSVLNQTYQNFEICIADDSSTNLETIQTLQCYENKDKRIKVVYRKENGHISKATNSALEIAEGEYIGLLDNDDILSPYALQEMVDALNKDKTLDMLYSDEDKIDLNDRRCDPNFKPDYSPDTLLSLNYICHFVLIRKEIMDKVGGFTVGLEGAQDYDLFLKVTEETSRIKHISKILYHWRMIPGSTSMSLENKSYAADKGMQAIENALKRRNVNAKVKKDEKSLYYYIDYQLNEEPMVSIIIPTKDHADVTRVCLSTLFSKTNYKNYEVLLMDNDSQEEETYRLFEEYSKYDNFKVVPANIPFNYSKINNMAVKESKGDVIILLNNDTEIIDANWLKTMVSYAIQPHIGAVGPKLLYPDQTVQHGGVIMGLGGVASHAYTGESKDYMGMYGRLCVPYNYAAVTAACLAVEKKKFLEVEGLEENLQVAYNDIDLNLKLLEKGYYNVFVPQTSLIHHESKSRGLDTEGEKYIRFKEEENYMYSKWEKYIKYDPFYNSNFTKKIWFLLDKD